MGASRCRNGGRQTQVNKDWVVGSLLYAGQLPRNLEGPAGQLRNTDEKIAPQRNRMAKIFTIYSGVGDKSGSEDRVSGRFCTPCDQRLNRLEPGGFHSCDTGASLQVV